MVFLRVRRKYHMHVENGLPPPDSNHDRGHYYDPQVRTEDIPPSCSGSNRIGKREIAPHLLEAASALQEALVRFHCNLCIKRNR